MTCLLCPKFDQKFRGGGGYFQKNWGGVRHASWNPYPISDQNHWFSLPYFIPDQKFDTLFQTWSPGAWHVTGDVRSCYSTYTVVGVNIKREMVLLPNDEEVANSSKKNIPNSRIECTNHTLFQTKTAKKNITFGAAHTYIAYIRDYPPWGKKHVADYE